MAARSLATFAPPVKDVPGRATATRIEEAAKARMSLRAEAVLALLADSHLVMSPTVAKSARGGGRVTSRWASATGVSV